LEILEYCEPEKCIEREQYYIDLLKPEYNLLKVAGSLLGFKHSEETKAKLSGLVRSEETLAKYIEANKGDKNPMHGKIHSEETRAKISTSRKANPCGSSQPSSQKIEIIDLETNITTKYNSMSEAAKALNIHNNIISQYFKKNQKKPYKGRYIFVKSLDT